MAKPPEKKKLKRVEVRKQLVSVQNEAAPSRRIYGTGQPEIDKAIQTLLNKASGTHDEDFLREIIVSAIKIGFDDMDRGDIKMINSAIKELRYALTVFYPYRHIRKVAIFGSARTPKTAEDYLLARDFAREIVKAGWMVITGASEGIMRAGNEGAGRANSFGVNIKLPFEQDANPFIAKDHKLINFKYFFTRKLIFVRESDATVLAPGGFGTHDEGFETLTLIQTGKATPRPVVCLDPPGSNYWKAWIIFIKKELVKRGMIDSDDLGIFHHTHSAKEAAQFVAHFYRNYHSMRYVQDQLVMRLKRPLEKKTLEKMNVDFRDMLKKGSFEQLMTPFDDEKNEPHTFDLVRLVFCFNRRHFARLYKLIEIINLA